MKNKKYHRADPSFYMSKSTPVDFYPTPPQMVKALLLREEFTGKILEPCCGNGQLAEILKTHGYDVFASDLVDHGYGKVKDFFNYKFQVENIVTNPPFAVITLFLQKAIPMTNRKCCVLMRLLALSGKERFEKIWSKFPPQRIYVFTKRYSFADGKTGGMLVTTWMVWDKESKNRNPELFWIP
jgi:hypothetical protein